MSVVAEPRRDVHAKRQDCVRLQPKIENLYTCRVSGFRDEPLNHSLVFASCLDDHLALLRPERAQLRVADESLLGMLRVKTNVCPDSCLEAFDGVGAGGICGLIHDWEEAFQDGRHDVDEKFVLASYVVIQTADLDAYAVSHSPE